MRAIYPPRLEIFLIFSDEWSPLNVIETISGRCLEKIVFL